MRRWRDGGRGRTVRRRRWARLLFAALAIGGLVGCGDTGSGRGEREAAQPDPPDASVQTSPTSATVELLPPATTPPSPTPTVVPTPTPIPIPTPRPVVERTLLFSGDVLSHVPVIDAARRYGEAGGDPAWGYDYRPMFDDVRHRVTAADLAICVLETPLSTDNTGLAGYPLFNAPRELAAALVDAGYDGCATASNHSIDRGPSGLRSTLDQMDLAGLGHAGMARTEEEAATPRIYDVDGLRVAHLSWTYGLNGLVLPDDSPWMVNVNDAEGIRAEAARARAAGADLVVLSIQWGNEYQRVPSVAQDDLAPLLTAAGGADVVIGNHAHVVQPVDWIQGVPVVFGLGNSLSNQFDNPNRTGTQDGVMIEVTVVGNEEIGWAVDRLAFVPTWVDRSTYTIIDVGVALAERSADDPLRPTLQASFDRTAEALGLRGHVLELADAP